MITMPPFARLAQRARAHGGAALATSLLCLAAMAPLHAQEAPRPIGPSDHATADGSAPAAAPNGTATRAWLGKQAQRQDASKTRQTQSGPVMTAVHDRYVKSFTNDIPSTNSLRTTVPTSR